MLEADRLAGNWKTAKRDELGKIIGRLGMSDGENVMAALIGQNPERFYNLSQAHHSAARKIEDLLSKTLQETGGLSEVQARRFLREELPKLRQARGDVARYDANNIYPETFQPFLDDIFKGEVTPTSNNAFGFALEMINLGARKKFYEPVYKDAKAALREWELAAVKGQIPREDVRFATSFADEFLDSVHGQRGEGAKVTAQILNGITQGFQKAGIRLPEVTPEMIDKLSDQLMSYYSGVAMSWRPAIAVRDTLQALMMGPKVGFPRAFKALKQIYTGGLDDSWWAGAAKELGLPDGINQPIYAENPEAFGLSRLGRGIKKLQETGNIPRRWVDKKNRFGVYRGGELAIEEEAPKLLNKQISWEEFLWNTGLKGSNKVDQDKIHALLMGRELADVSGAARTYGKMLSDDVNFIYSGANAPLMFKGTIGRMFGQFGMWPVGFTEYMWQNMATPDNAWRLHYASGYAALMAATLSAGNLTGIDTSTWAAGNPLTFQGGPWFQGMRDIATMVSTNNEFEQRKARANVSRMVSHFGTPFAGALNPVGGLTTDLIQARNAENPLEALALALGFNLQTPTPATRR
jgi:hypothetical protein